MLKLPSGWDKPAINLILVCFMCYAIYSKTELDQMFWTIIFFQLGIRAGSAGADASADEKKKLAEENTTLRAQNVKLTEQTNQLVIKSMREGKPIILPTED